jgi:hypothetical protein
LQDGPSGPASYVLILNPYKVIQHQLEQKHPGVRQDKYNALMERALEVGDESLLPPEPAPSAAPETPAPALPPATAAAT